MNIEISPKEYERRLNWHDAMMYCQLLVIDDTDDWRLPTIEELSKLYISETLKEEEIYQYWSSTTCIVDDSLYIWGKDMDGGYEGRYLANNRYFHARPVRTI